MAYTVLARRFRSQTFDDVVGQDAVAQTLKNAIKSGRVAHAYLFSGTRGVGKTTMARILAKSINCLNAKEPTADPCCKCDSCIAINAGDDIDVIEIDGASNTGVDNIRQLRQNAIYRPARARNKIYIIDEVHMLSTGAFNALLKILEEPPEHVKFIFATTEPNKVLATIQSRCQRFDFNSISPTDIAKQLKLVLNSEKIKFEDDLVLHIARLANGSMRDGLSLLDQLISAGVEPLTVKLLEEFLGQPNREKICGLIDNIASHDAAAVLTKVDSLLKTGQSCTQIADAVTDIMRDLMVVISAGVKSELLVLTADEQKVMAKLAEKFDIPAIIYNITALEKLRWTIKNSDNPRALLEASMLRLALSEHFLGIDQLMAQLKGQALSKKKAITPAKPAGHAPKDTLANTTDFDQADNKPTVEPVISGQVTIDNIRENWSAILASAKGGNTVIAGTIAKAKPLSFNENVLTIGFPGSLEFSKNRCENKSHMVAAFLSAAIGIEVSLRFEMIDDEEDEKKFTPAGAKRSHKEQQEILRDPAVKTVIAGLNASLKKIEEPIEIPEIE